MKLFKKLAVSLTASATLAAGGLAVAAGDAHAATWSPGTLAFCKPKCGIDIGATTQMRGVTEGVAFNVNVEGKPGTTAKIRAFMWTEKGLVPVSSIVMVPLPASSLSTSMKSVNMIITPLKSPLTSIDKVYIQPSDITTAHLKEGYYVASNADASPGTAKPLKLDIRSARAGDGGWKGALSDGIFHRSVDNGIPGHVYGVQMYVKGTWRDVTNSFAKVSSRGVTAVQGKVPVVPAGKYYVRIYNKTKGIYDLTPPNSYYITVNAFDVYTRPGYWDYNGRKWRTTCEPYSATERCRTEIYATTVQYVGGRFVSKAGYVFNNLTYKPSRRSIWAKNPLGAYGKVSGKAAWTAADGSKWKTDCDTAATGRGACRSYRWTKVVASMKTSSGYSYRIVSQWVFNNIVRFSN